MTTLFIPYALVEACADYYDGMMDPLYALYCRSSSPLGEGFGDLEYRGDDIGYPVDLDDEDIAALDGMAQAIRTRSMTDEFEESEQDASEDTRDERHLWAADVWVNVSAAHDEEQERRAYWESTRHMTRQELIEHRVLAA